MAQWFEFAWACRATMAASCRSHLKCYQRNSKRHSLLCRGSQKLGFQLHTLREWPNFPENSTFPGVLRRPKPGMFNDCSGFNDENWPWSYS